MSNKLEVTKEERAAIEKWLEKTKEREPSSEVKTVSNEKRIYRCRGKDCGFATDDLDVYIHHLVDEAVKASPPKVEEKRWGEETPKTHSTVKDYLECPECYPKFEKAMLEHPKFLESLKARGYVKEEEKPKRAKKGLEI